MKSTNKVYIQKEFNHPIQMIYDALTQESMVIQWFGPLEMKTIDCQIDLEIHGKFSYKIQKQDRSVFRIQGQYLELSPPHKIKFTMYYENLPGTEHLNSLVTIHLTEKKEKTLLSFIQEFEVEPPNMHDRTASWNDMFKRLDRQLVIK